MTYKALCSSLPSVESPLCWQHLDPLPQLPHSAVSVNNTADLPWWCRRSVWQVGRRPQTSSALDQQKPSWCALISVIFHSVPLSSVLFLSVLVRILRKLQCCCMGMVYKAPMSSLSLSLPARDLDKWWPVSAVGTAPARQLVTGGRTGNWTPTWAVFHQTFSTILDTPGRMQRAFSVMSRWRCRSLCNLSQVLRNQLLYLIMLMWTHACACPCCYKYNFLAIRFHYRCFCLLLVFTSLRTDITTLGCLQLCCFA